jgi:hypothetical protein
MFKSFSKTVKTTNVKGTSSKVDKVFEKIDDLFEGISDALDELSSEDNVSTMECDGLKITIKNNHVEIEGDPGSVKLNGKDLK